MNFIKELFYYLLGRVPIELHEYRPSNKLLLHISDTPSSFFAELSRIIHVVKPDFIVHTGDLVDNIKLELYPGSIWRYERDIKRLISILEQSDAKEIYLAMGNHDHVETVQKLSKRCHIIPKSEIIDLGGHQISIAHNLKDILEIPGAYHLFGHNLAQKSGYFNEKLYLNGITGIHVIELGSNSYHSYPYPYGTDNDRLGRGKIGL